MENEIYKRCKTTAEVDLLIEESGRLTAVGFGIHWPEIDEDLSTEDLLAGTPAPPGSVPASA